ncbi:MAG: PD-(D/E)XK nuclease family protein [Methylophilus sp.]|nr:PD-(D/E)XK nuclease family protein [Methylophilus sp.]
MNELLSKLITDDDFERMRLELNAPNIFSALAVQRKEIRHSNFIGYLLDPNETHQLNDLVLRRVLRDIFNESKNNLRNIFDADDIDYSNVEIRREWRNIDVLIILKEDVVVIENKVDSVDHSKQLSRYKEIADKSFTGRNIHYVYLTPDGDNPQDEASRENYINYSYEKISKIIESILSLYRNSISEKIYFYLSDYLSVLKRELLMNDLMNDLARRVYSKHKEVLDFIFENMPDPINEVYPLFEKEIIDAGYVVCSKNRGTVRFYTKEIDELLPKDGEGWGKKESFAFEIKFGDRPPKFIAVISRGNQETQEIIHAPLKSSNYYKEPSGKKWLVVASQKIDFFSNEKIAEQSEEDIKNKIKKIVSEIKPIVDDFHHLLINDDNVKRLK